MVALLTVASGTSIVTENLYDSRFRYVGELARMGADISIESQHAVIRGKPELSGCPVLAPDIRAGAALVRAAYGLKAPPLSGTPTTLIAGIARWLTNCRAWEHQSPERSNWRTTSRISRFASVAALLAVTTTAPPELAEQQTIDAGAIVITAAPGQLLGVGDYLFAGPLTIRDGPTASPSRKLSAPRPTCWNREVPFSWPVEA